LPWTAAARELRRRQHARQSRLRRRPPLWQGRSRRREDRKRQRQRGCALCSPAERLASAVLTAPAGSLGAAVGRSPGSRFMPYHGDHALFQVGSLPAGGASSLTGDRRLRASSPGKPPDAALSQVLHEIDSPAATRSEPRFSLIFACGTMVLIPHRNRRRHPNKGYYTYRSHNRNRDGFVATATCLCPPPPPRSADPVREIRPR
jgi:hypothetical protein